MSFAACAVAVARKDLVTEWRSREVLPALAQFGAMFATQPVLAET